jgi:hypothetical protein
MQSDLTKINLVHTFAIQNLRHSASASEDLFEVVAREPLLLHTQLDGRDRIRRLDPPVPLFIRLH